MASMSKAAAQEYKNRVDAAIQVLYTYSQHLGTFS